MTIEQQRVTINLSENYLLFRHHMTPGLNLMHCPVSTLCAIHCTQFIMTMLDIVNCPFYLLGHENPAKYNFLVGIEQLTRENISSI